MTVRVIFGHEDTSSFTDFMSWVIERVSLTTDFMSSVTDLISWVSEPQHVRTSYVTGKSPRLTPTASHLPLTEKLTLPAFRRTLGAWQSIVSTIGTDPFTLGGADVSFYIKVPTGELSEAQDLLKGYEFSNQK